ncbi:MAG TPA: hypothetical protein VJR04_12750, partial [Terriglobales bacterium]|nr:hypothetical protein [Terriglobales bacterium]
RTHERAQQMAEKIGGSAIRFDRLYETADRADIVITSTGAPHVIFRREHGELFMHRRKNRPMFFIDIAVPRDVDPEMGEVDGVFTYNIDDLQQIVESNVSDRGREAQRAEALIEEEVERFRRRMQTLDAVPTILALQQRMEQIRQDEIERLRAKLGPLTPEQQSTIENLTRSIVNKILHPPISALKNASGSEELTTTSEILRGLFGLELASHTNGFVPEEERSKLSPPESSKSGLSAEKSEADKPALKFTARS